MSGPVALDDVKSELAVHGYAHVVLGGAIEDDLASLKSLLGSLGHPIHVFRNQPFWKPLNVDLERPAGRSSGIGFNSLHIDCVNVTMPPDIVVLYCERPDPQGGGANIVADTVGLAAQLTRTTIDLLATKQVKEGRFFELDHVGEEANPFTVYSDSSWPWRYSGRLVEAASHDHGAAFDDALLELDRTLMLRAEEILLRRGEALIVDQRRALHGRMPLGPGQEDVASQDRRLLLQAYARAST